ncbi:ABC transporter [Candidatus Formimonas warabiya]|uniref:ABC transporter n=2 Tax=Formimonas warabiya TaxID=1761012 RepID=A0A3G1KQS0_FORW1|nr:ABC transporter [Candidatus Formimonas warabiya]
MDELKSRTIVAAQNLEKKFGDFPAVKGVNFEVYRGECFGLLGPNGAGKTSIAKMIYGFSPVTSGTLEVFGADIRVSARKAKARIGVVPQEDNLDPDLSVTENLLIYAGYFKINRQEAKKRVQDILAFMELSDKADAVVDHLSGGLKRRLTIGRALINQPELLILDEPTTGLDPYARHLVWQRLRKLKEAGTTLLLTTHYLEEAHQLCDRLLVIYRGEILDHGTPLELMKRHVGKEALELEIDSSLEGSLTENSGELILARQRLGDDLVFFTNEGEELVRRLQANAERWGIMIHYSRLRPTNLEDVFLKLTGESLGKEEE